MITAIIIFLCIMIAVNSLLFIKFHRVWKKYYKNQQEQVILEGVK